MLPQVVYEGKLTSLRRVKDDVKDVSHGLECGIRVDGFSSWREGDEITAFQVGGPALHVHVCSGVRRTHVSCLCELQVVADLLLRAASATCDACRPSTVWHRADYGLNDSEACLLHVQVAEKRRTLEEAAVASVDQSTAGSFSLDDEDDE